MGGGWVREGGERGELACFLCLSPPGFVKCSRVDGGFAGRFGICSYQQERSALQRLPGEGGGAQSEDNTESREQRWRPIVFTYAIVRRHATVCGTQ